ncbi:MAG: hypothetical protein Q9177_005971 [Variospora cf. flavescens]
MHELLLHASVPTARHAQVLSVLAGVAAMQPQPFHERHLIYKPTRPPTRAAVQIGGSQAVQQNSTQKAKAGLQEDLFYLHLVEDLVEDAEKGGMSDGDVVMEDVHGLSGEDEVSGMIEDEHSSGRIQDPSHTDPKSSTRWTFQFRDVPEPGNRRPCTTRLIADTPITGGDGSAFMSAMEYTHTSTHHLVGHRLTHLSTSILLFRPCRPPSSSAQKPEPIDPRTYILQVSLRVSNGIAKPQLMSRGVKELMSLKETLRGVVELESVERGMLDTRMK